MFTLFIILMIMGLGVMICEKIEEIKDEIEYKITTRKLAKYYNSEEYKMKKKEEELKEEEEKRRKEEQKRIEAEKRYEDDDYFLNDYDYYRAYYKDMYGITVGRFPGEASPELKNKIKTMKETIDEAANAEKKIKELKEKQEKVLQRKEELKQLINDRKGKQITMDEWRKEIDKQNIIKEIKEQKEKEALNNGGIQMSLFEEETIVTEEEIKNYKHKQNEEFIKDTEAFLKELEERDRREAEEFMRNYINNNLPCRDTLKDFYERRMERYKSRYPELYFEIEIEDLDI